MAIHNADGESPALGHRGNVEVLDDHALVVLWANQTAPAGQRQAAFHTIVRRYQHRLFSVCFRMLHSAADAEEAVQETFVRLARHAHGFRGDAQVSTWLYSIARNVCTDRVRYSARRPSVPVADITLVGGNEAAPDDMATSDTVATLREALLQLDERSRTLLLLIAVDELSYEEAAELTGLAVGTIKSRVSRARVQLGRLLGDPSDDDPATAVEGPPSSVQPDPTSTPRGPP